MKRDNLDLLACPACHAPLTLHNGTAGPLESGRLRCERCQKDYPIEQGIPHFVQPMDASSGGWTWYTGSSGWMYRLGLEAILGISRVGGELNINPCIPRHWPGFKVDYRFGTTHYKISVENPHNLNRGIRQVLLDGNPLPGSLISLVDDGQQHEVHVLMG